MFILGKNQNKNFSYKSKHQIAAIDYKNFTG